MLCSLFLNLESFFNFCKCMLISSLLCSACSGHGEWLITVIFETVLHTFEIYFKTTWCLLSGLNTFLQTSFTFCIGLIILLDHWNLWYLSWTMVPLSKEFWRDAFLHCLHFVQFETSKFWEVLFIDWENYFLSNCWFELLYNNILTCITSGLNDFSS